MTFLNLFMLVGVLAAGIPVAIHLFFRSRYRTVPWAAMKFLLTSVEQTSRRLKFQEYALLVLRMMVLTLLAVAFMRPVNLTLLSCIWVFLAALLFCMTLSWWVLTWSPQSFLRTIVQFVVSYAIIGVLWIVLLVLYPFLTANPSAVVRGSGDAVDAFFVFDLSYSMSAKDQDAKTRLKLAQEEAHKIIDELPPHSTVKIITCAGNDRAILGPHTPTDFVQARKLIDGLDVVHLATDLQQGVGLANEIIKLGQASNKELYIFSDMQKMGFEQQAGDLKKTLQDIKEKAVVHMVRCGTRTPRNVAIVDIKPQSGVPRPGERVGFAVLVRNSGAESVENLKVSLTVDGDDKNMETTAIAKIKPSETHAVTLTGKLDKPGLRVLSAKVSSDDLEADNRFEQVILVRDQVNILVVDGGFHPRDPARSSSYFLMHALLPVKDADRATYHLQPRVISPHQAAPALLMKQDIVILVNCALQGKRGPNVETLPADFVESLDPFVRKGGHGLIIFGGDNVQPESYNKLLGKKLGLLPMPLKSAVKATENKPFFIDRGSFGPPSFWKFKDDDYYKDFSKVEIWQTVALDEGAPQGKEKDKKKLDPQDQEQKDEPEKKDDNPVGVVARLQNGLPLIVSRKADAGEVIFVGTAADPGQLDEKTLNPSWTDWPLRLALYVPFVDVTTSHLLHGQTQTYNLVAGQNLGWYPTDKFDHVYSLVNPDRSLERLDTREAANKRIMVSKREFTHAGVYRLISQQRGLDGEGTIDIAAALKTGTPIAVTPDLTESIDLSSLSEKELDEQIGFTPIHIVAGAGAAISTGTDRLNREWTAWVLLAVLMLVLVEVAFAWWCGRAW